MKKLILAGLVLIGFTGIAAAMVGQECPSDEMCATSKAVPTPYNSSVAEDVVVQPSFNLTVSSNACAGNESDSVQLGDYYTRESFPPHHRIEFMGTVVASNPCQNLEYNISEEGGVYTVNIYSVDSNGGCTECIGTINYNADFEVTAEYLQVNIQHNGEDVTSFAPPQEINEGGFVEDEPRNDQDNPIKTGFLTYILDFIQGLF